MNDSRRQGEEPLQRPRAPLRQSRRQCRRRRRAHRRTALVRARGRARQGRRRARRGARRAERPDHEGGAAARHHPRGAAGRICRRARSASKSGAADGLAVRPAAHGGGAWTRLGGEVRAASTHEAAASASLGQVHRATSHDGRALAAKLQYPDMQSAVEADLAQLSLLFSIHRRMSPAIETSEMLKEISARLREELDYDLEARHTRLYGIIFSGRSADPRAGGRARAFHQAAAHHELARWAAAARLHRSHRSKSATRSRAPCFAPGGIPFSHYGVIHGDPHLGNYTVFEDGDGRAAGINLLDYGCMRTFAPEIHPRRDRSLSRPAERRPRAGRARLRDLGLRRPLQRADRHPQYLGEFHLRPDAR